MSSLSKIKKYERALITTTFFVEHNPKVNLTKLRKELKINKNFVIAIVKLNIIKNIGSRRRPNYILLKQSTPELALEVLNYANEMSALKNPIVKTKTIIETHVGTIQPRRTFLQRIFDFFKF